MPYYAKLKDKIIEAEVETVIVATADVVAAMPGDWVETFIADPTKKYAGPGFRFNGADYMLPLTDEEKNIKAAAITNTRDVVAINRLTIQQAKTWLKNKVHAGVTEESLYTLLTSATTIAAMKPILTKIIRAQYAQTEADEQLLAALISIWDQTMPDR